MNIPYFSSHLRCKEVSEDPCEGGLNSAERVRGGGGGGGGNGVKWGNLMDSLIFLYVLRRNVCLKSH